MVRFGRGAVDVATRQVEFEGEPRHLEPQAFDLLAYLLAHRDRVVPKSELLDEVWGDQFVSESALTTRVKEVRRALGDDGIRQEVVRNYRGRGYRFVAAVEPEPPGDGSTTVDHASLIGRDGDLEAITGLLDSAALVTLVGPGGVGKTTLAGEIVRRERGRRPGGAVVVRLSEVRDDENVVHALRRDTDLLAAETDDDLLSAIADLDALLVVDNCEHVLDEVARLLAGILRHDGPVRVLATSRERTGLQSEQVWPVAPLDPAAARDLLERRARTTDPGYEWKSEEQETVATLLATLDHLPLAIEMAGSRLPSLGVAHLAELLAHRVDLLRSPDRSAADRHRSVRALVDWSEQLLSEEERGVLVGLTAFAGPIGADDLGAVLHAEPTDLTVGPLARLVDHSLVVAEVSGPSTRYRLLETVRAAVAPRRTENLDARHAHHVLEVAAAADAMLRTPHEPAAARRLHLLFSELRIAHRWAREHEPALAAAITTAIAHYAYERQLLEPVAWADDLLPLLESDDPARLGVLAVLAADASNRGRYDRAGEFAGEAISAEDHRVRGSAHDTLSNVGLYTGDLATAIDHSRALCDLGMVHDDAFLFAAGVSGQVLGCVYGGRLPAARELLRLVEPPRPPGPTGSAWIAYAEAELLAAEAKHDEATRRFDEAIALGERVGNRFVIGVAQVSQLAARIRSGDVEAAKAAFVPLLRQYRRVHSTTHGVTALRNLVELLVSAHDDRDAMVLLGALSGPTVKSTYGTESERLDGARRAVEARAGADLVDAWVEEGSTHTAVWALDHAIAMLTS